MPAPLPMETRLTRSLVPPETTSRVPLWLRRTLLVAGIACLAVALLGFVVFALRAVSIA
jgi:hypothetical protein